METENQMMQNVLSKNIIKEIELLPMEFREKSEEVSHLQSELNELREKYGQKENQINKISKEIINIENGFSLNLEEISNIKSEQKLIIDSLDEEAFKKFTKKFYEIPNNIQEIILIFLKYEGNLKEELNFLLLKFENLHQLLRDSYSYFKSLEEMDVEKYEKCKEKIKNLKKENINNNKNKISSPFDLIINFIDNTFRIIDITRYNKEINKNISQKCSLKGKLFIENKILQEGIKEKQEKLKNINLYINYINNILIKYKNYFGNSNNNKSNNSNNQSNHIKNISSNRYDNIDNKSNSLLESKNKINNNIKDENISSKPNINSNNDKVRNKDNDKVIFLKSNNNEEKIKINNINILETKNNNFYHAVNNCKKNTEPGPSLSSSQLNNPNNIKIISILNTTNKHNKENGNIINNIRNSQINSNSIDLYNKRQNVYLNDFSATNPKEGKKIKIGSLSMYQSSTSKKYKNKIIKTNSFEQVESRKIIINRPIENNEPNKSFEEIRAYENIKKINDKNISEYNERNLLRNNKLLYYSYQMNDIDNNKEDKNKNKMNIKEEDEKKINVDKYNNNIFVEHKQNENIEINKKKNFNLSPGIYNNNRKILKMLEMNKVDTNKKNNK